MKALSLPQPYASLCLTKSPTTGLALKEWETRSWTPSIQDLRIIRRDGLFIHSKETLSEEQRVKCVSWPFWIYKELCNQLPFGQIIGKVTVGRIITTNQWMEENFNNLGIQQKIDMASHHQIEFGNYSLGRYAWEFLTYEKIDGPIISNYSSGIWDFESAKRKKATQLALF